MKTLLKYIALLLVSGVIIPICCNPLAVKPVLGITTATKQVIDNPVKRNGAYPFSFTHDVAAKLLPVLNLFK